MLKLSGGFADPLSLKHTYARREGITLAEAQEMIEDAKARIRAGEAPEKILHEEFGLEPDYVWELL